MVSCLPHQTQEPHPIKPWGIYSVSLWAVLKQWLLPGWHVATLEQSINGDTVRRMARCCLAQEEQEDVAASSPVTAFRLGVARAAPSPSDPSCTLNSQEHRAVTKPEHWSEGKTLLQPLQITEASLASPQRCL